MQKETARIIVKWFAIVFISFSVVQWFVAQSLSNRTGEPPVDLIDFILKKVIALVVYCFIVYFLLALFSRKQKTESKGE